MMKKCSKSSKGEQQKPNVGSKPKNQNVNFNKISHAGQTHMTRSNNAYFYGYYFSCNYFGHKAMNCRIFPRRNFSFVNQNPFAPLRNYNIICYKYNNFGHSTKFSKSVLTDSSKKVDAKRKAKENVRVWKKKERPS